MFEILRLWFRMSITKTEKDTYLKKRLLFLFVPNRFEVTFGEFLNVKPYRSWGKKKKKEKKNRHNFSRKSK